jgi:prepilin-type N-terminal cleavage/methylation domain-containing protein
MRKNNNKQSNLAKGRDGFTLIEIIVTMSIIILLSGAVVGLNYVVGQTQLISFNSLLTVESANRVVSTLARELRTSQYSENGIYPIEYADAQEIIFYSDINFDGNTERVRYYLDDTILYKTTVPSSGNPPAYIDTNSKTTIVAEHIRNGGSPIFFYYDENFPETNNVPLTFPAPIGDVRVVQIVIRSNEQANFPDKDYILDTYIQLRLLKNEES